MNNYIIIIICLIIILIGILSYSFFINSEKFDAAPGPIGVGVAAGGAAATQAATTQGVATTASLLNQAGYLKKNIKKVDDMIKSLTEAQLIGFLEKDTNGNLTVAATNSRDGPLKFYFEPSAGIIQESPFGSPMEYIIPIIIDSKKLHGYSNTLRDLIICTYLLENAPDTDPVKSFAKTENIICTTPPPAPAATSSDNSGELIIFISFFILLFFISFLIKRNASESNKV